MTPTCQRAIRSLLECARLNAVRARQSTSARLAAYYTAVSAGCARDARALRATAR